MLEKKRKMRLGGQWPLVDRLEQRSYLTGVSFGAPSFVTGIDHISGIATGHLNGDAADDIVVAGVTSGTSNSVVGVYLSKNGVFGTPTLIPINGTTGGVAIGDFLGNGHQDIALVNAASGTLSVLLNDGTGSFSQGVGAGIGGAGGDTQLVSADFNHDGKGDLAVVEPNDNAVGVFFSIGDQFGRFASEANISVPSPSKVAVGDFNNDAFPDFAILSLASPNSIYVAMNDGHGNFNTPTQFSIGGNVQSISDVAAANLHGGTNPDIVGLGIQAGTSAGVVGVLTNQGGGAFTAAGPATVAAGALLAATGTFSGSGKQDVASISSAGALDVLPGDGSGGFGPDQQVFTTQLGTPATLAVVGDFNGDANPDIAFISAATSGGFGVVLNTPGGTVTPPPPPGTSTLTPTVVGPLPTAPIIAGVKIRPIREKVVLTNNSSTMVKGPVLVSLLLSAATKSTSTDPVIASLNIRRLILKPHQSKTEILTIKAPLPASASGSYYLVGQVTDPTQLQSEAASSTTFPVVPPVIDLSGTFTKVPAAAKIGRPVSIAFNIANRGNVSAIGPLTVNIYASASGVIDSGAVQIDSLVRRRVSIASGKQLPIHVNKSIANLTPGSYFLIFQIDPANAFHDLNISNNTIVSPSPAVAVS